MNSVKMSESLRRVAAATETLKVCLSFNQRIVNQSRTKPWFLFRTFFFSSWQQVCLNI